MGDHQHKRVFVPPKRRLFLSILKSSLAKIAIFVFAGIVFVKPDIQLAAMGIFAVCIIEILRFRNYAKKQIELLEIIISPQDIYGLPDIPWFNGFRAVEKISIPFDKIDKHKTGTLKAKRWWSGNLIWSTDGKSIVLSNDFAEGQLREIAGLIGCPVE